MEVGWGGGSMGGVYNDLGDTKLSYGELSCRAYLIPTPCQLTEPVQTRRFPWQRRVTWRR